MSLSSLQLWLARAADQPLDDVDWRDRAPIAQHIGRIPEPLEDRILEVRQRLRDESALGEYGAAAVRRELELAPDLGHRVPSLRTIGRVFERRGVLDGQRRVRRPAPPAGWHLPDVRAREAELDSFDVVEGLRLLGGATIDVLTGLSLHGALPAAWPMMPGVSAASAVAALRGHWQLSGLPAYAQFDNDSRFDGGHRHPNSIGAIIRLCLTLGVVPVFAPPRELGFQSAIEAFNGRWQRMVWERAWAADLADLQLRSERYLAAWRDRRAVRIEAAPPRRPYPVDPSPELHLPPAGRLVFVRRTNDVGAVQLLAVTYPVSRLWVRRLVRADIDLAARRLSFFALRRREPDLQPLLADTPFEPPERWYR